MTRSRSAKKSFASFSGADQELATLADSPQALISAVHRLGGLCFLAHPVDPAMPAFGERIYPGWTGISPTLPVSNYGTVSVNSRR